jgi:hypothetical protein
MFIRPLVEWTKRVVLETAAKELFAEAQSADAVVTDPPTLALEVESTPVIEAPEKTTRKKAAKKK